MIAIELFFSNFRNLFLLFRKKDWAIGSYRMMKGFIPQIYQTFGDKPKPNDLCMIKCHDKCHKCTKLYLVQWIGLMGMIIGDQILSKMLKK